MTILSKDCYKVLGVHKNASIDEIKKVYRKLARQLHPDINPNEHVSGEKFKEVQKAYKILIEEHQKQYNEKSNYHKSAIEKENDIYQDITISFIESFYGTQRTIIHTDNNGKISIQQIKIKGGVKNNQKICFKGRGIPAKNGGTPGNLFAIIHVEDHPIYKRKDDDIYFVFEIPYTTAVLGGEIKVPGIERNLKVMVPPMTKDSSLLRIKHRGFFNFYNNKRGIFFVKVRIKVPDTLNRLQEEKLYSLRNLGL